MKIIVTILGILFMGSLVPVASTAGIDTEALRTDYVCMINNQYMAEKQIPVEVEGKTYYGCCPGCVVSLQTKRNVRYAVDPYSGQEVDKAKAFIVRQSEGSKEVFYFESEGNYRQFLEK